MSPESRRRFFDYLVIFCGEFIATAFLMVYGCMCINDRQLTVTHAAVAWAFLVSSVIMAFAHITQCHINPCVTVCFLLLGLTGPFAAVVYFVAEMLGAISGTYLALVILKDSMLSNVTNPDAGYCMTSLNNNISVTNAFIIEFLATSLLIFAVCSATDHRNTQRGDSVAIKIGFVVGILVFGAGPLTGASMNPARSFAPALLHMKWKHHWLYWVSTLSGAICTTLLYRVLFSAPAEEEIILKISRPVIPGALVVDANNPKTGTTKMESSNLSSQLETEIAIEGNTPLSH